MPSLDPEQYANAVTIYQVGVKMGMSARDIQIALITAMQESSLRNLKYGDRDSQGLFQQRPSQGWGTVEQVTDPIYATRKFFTELKKVENRGSMAMTEAAQAVQRSAFPDAYAKHISLVQSIWPGVQKKAGGKPLTMDGEPYREQPGDAGFQTTNTFAPGLDPDGGFDVDTTDLAGYLLGPGTPPMLGAPQLGPDGAVDPDVEMFTSPLRPMSNDEFTVSTGRGYGKGVSGWRKAVVEEARQYLGTPYAWGGTTPDGFDCSGLLQYVFGKYGIDLPRVSYQQANAGKRIGIDGLKPGDLVAWDNSSRNHGADHIALYIGNGKIIEAPRTGLSVRVRDLESDEDAWGVRMKG